MQMLLQCFQMVNGPLGAHGKLAFHQTAFQEILLGVELVGQKFMEEYKFVLLLERRFLRQQAIQELYL